MNDTIAKTEDDIFMFISTIINMVFTVLTFMILLVILSIDQYNRRKK